MFNEIHGNVRASERSCMAWRMVHLWPMLVEYPPPPSPGCLSEAASPLSGPKIQGIPTFEDYNGLISAFISNNRGKTFAWFLNPCYWETLPLGQRFFDDSEQIMHDWSLSWQTKGKYWKKKNLNMVKKKNRKEKLATRTANMAFAQVVDIQHWVISRRFPGTGFF